MERKLSNIELESIAKKEIELLKKYNYEPTKHGVMEGLEVWNENKARLRSILSKHPNWNEELQMIQFDSDFNREVDHNRINEFVDWIKMQLITTGKMDEQCYKMIELIRNESNCLIDNEIAAYINSFIPSIKANEGMKMTRVVLKFCKIYGIDKVGQNGEFGKEGTTFNKIYARYCDAITPLKIKRHTIISINPLDYLTMSFGNSWSSCHTIDKENIREMPNSYEGIYSSGTLSYMLDNVSMVFYTLSSEYDGEEPYLQGKINRNMIHYANLDGKDVILQGRVYPQSCDSDQDHYKKIRMIIQKVFADCLGINNLWKNKKGTTVCSDFIYDYDEGTHYKDYLNFDVCNISIPTEQFEDWSTDVEMIIGHAPICPVCGDEHNNEECIECEDCYEDENDEYCGDCGCRISDGNGSHWSNHRDEYLCEDCVYYCERCGEYFRYEDLTSVDRGSYTELICPDCLSNGNYVECENCEEYHHLDDMYFTEDSESYYCKDCIDNVAVRIDGKYYEYDYEECCECEGYVKKEDVIEYKGNIYCSDCYEEKLDNENELDLAEGI